tara:strand:- start:660 stop:1214 length:555 start_codon:yes stop_codon:yes gene_type:complete
MSKYLDTLYNKNIQPLQAFMSLISFSDLATLKNVSRQAIYDRKRRGFFNKAIVKHNGKEVLNAEIALQLWEKNDVNIPRSTTKKQLKDKIDSLPANEIPDFAESKAKREFYLAELAKLDVEEKKKELISVEEIKKSSFAKGRAIRESLMNIANRLSNELAGEKDAKVIHKIITREHLNALENLT